MERIIKIVITTLASIVAFVFFIVGIRKLKIKKRGLFAVTLMLSLAIMGCKTTKKSDNRTGVISMEKIEKTKEWQKFKEKWKKIDKLNENPFDFPDSINKGIIEKEIEDAIEELKKVTPTDLKEFDMLLFLCKARLNIASDNMSRMIVHAPITDTPLYRIIVINNFENSIRELAKLRTAKTSERDYNFVIGKMIVIAKSFFLIDTIDKNYFSFRPAPLEDYFNVQLLSDVVIKKFEEDYQNRKQNNTLSDEFEIKYRTTKQQLKETEQLFEKFKPLLEDLFGIYR